MRLLVVEDEPDLRGALAAGLRNEGYAVDESPDGEDALIKGQLNSYDLVVLDVGLPGADGFEVCRALRDGDKPPLVLMLTARDTVDDRVDGLDAGADDYLVKPFDFRELHARLRALTRREMPERPSQLQLGALWLDPATREVRVDEDLITLTTKEWSVLNYLIRRPGEVISAEELLAHVWDDQVDPFTNTVRVQVGTLRKKIGSDRIETVIGAGYRLIDPASPSASG